MCNRNNRNFTKSRKFASKRHKVNYLAIKENTYEFSKIILVHKCSTLSLKKNKKFKIF
jgi:hypothetical protein